MNKNLLIGIVAAVLMLLVGGGIAYFALSGDSKDDTDWEAIIGSSSIADYEHYLQSHPKGDHAEEAKAQLTLLRDQDAKKRDEEEWQKAVAENTIEAYRNYHNSYTLHAEEAKERIDAIIREQIAEEEGASSGQPVEEPATAENKPQPAEKKTDATEKRPERTAEPATARTETPRQTTREEPQPAPQQQRTPTVTITPVQQQSAQPSVTQVTVTSNIPKAMVVIDGQDVGWAPWSGTLTPGMHTFAVKANNKAKLKTQDFNLRVSGTRTTIPINVPDPSVFK